MPFMFVLDEDSSSCFVYVYEFIYHNYAHFFRHILYQGYMVVQSRSSALRYTKVSLYSETVCH